MKAQDINLDFANNSPPAAVLEAFQVYKYLKKIRTNTSTVNGDIPACLIQEFAAEMSTPLVDIIDCLVNRGEYAGIWKI